MSGKTVVICPGCEGRGRRHKIPGRDPGYVVRTTLSAEDYTMCEMCEGSGRVFVVPARVIGPAPKKGKM